jgi:voltage-gated potassium channel
MWKRKPASRNRPVGSARANWAIVRRLLQQLLVAGALLVGCGFVYWWIEPRVHTLADGMWLAFVTASTVGYGDVIPTTTASRVFTIVVVLLGFAVLSLVTAAIAAALVGSQERSIEREILHDLHREIAAVRADLAALRATAQQRPAPRDDGAERPGVAAPDA